MNDSPSTFVRHEEYLLELTAPGADLSTTGPYASVKQANWYGPRGPLSSRRLAQERLVMEYEGLASPARARRAIVTAGPSGAGKSTALRSSLAVHDVATDSFRSIDPDVFKDHLLRLAERDGSFALLQSGPRLQQLLGAGVRFHPREYGSLVHTESCALAVETLRKSLARGDNLIHDGTMPSRAGASKLIKPLQKAGYQVTIVHVECSLDQAIERTRDRWRAGRQRALAEPPGSTSDRALGARFVPPDYVASLYPPERPDRSHSSDIARWAFHHYPAVTELHSYRVPPGQKAPVLERIQHKTPDGRIIDTKPSGDELPAHIKELRRAMGPQRLDAQRPTPTGTTPARPPGNTRRRPNQLER